MSLFGWVFGSVAAPALDGQTPVYQETGADPTVAPGLDRPPGSIAKFGSAYYWKYGAAATNWTLAPFVSGGGGSPLTTKGDLFGFSTLNARLPVGADGTSPTADSSAALGLSYKTTAKAADWTITNVRYYFLDYDAGIDTQTGFIDAAAGSTFTALQTAAVAIKTMERLYQIVPQVGNGRDIVILQKLRAAGANYLDQDGVTQSNLDTSRWSGYRLFLWRGSTDLSNDTTDRVTCGFFTAVAGPGASSEFTCAAGASTTLVPIAAGTIAAEGATQFRIRFLATTTTVALRGICRNITSCVANTSVTCGNALPATPAAGDTFVIERPGVRVNKFNFAAQNNGFGNAFPGPIAPQVVGIAATTTGALTVVMSGWRMGICGIEQTASNTNGVVFVNSTLQFLSDFSYTDEAGTGRTVGLGLRYSAGGTFLSRGGTMVLSCLGAMNLAVTNSMAGAMAGGMGSKSYLGGSWVITGLPSIGCREAPGTSAFAFTVGDSVTTNAQPRVVASASVTPFTLQSALPCWRLNFEGFAGSSHGAIYIKSVVGGAMNIDGCTSDGTPTLAIDVSGSWGVTLLVGNTIANTLAGTIGDIRLGPLNSTNYAAMADLTKVGFVDPNGNTIMGTAGLTSGQAFAVTNLEGSTLTPGNVVYLFGPSQVKKANAGAAATAKVDGIMVTTTLNNGTGLMVSPVGSGAPYVQVDGLTLGGNLLYLSPTAGVVTATVPPLSGTNQLLRVGRSFTSGASAIRAVLHPELMPVTSDGVGP